MVRVLLVDDDPALNELMAEGLIEMGFDVMTAFSGNDAMNVIAAGDFDIIVTDMYMPNGGGQQLIKWCREVKPKQKILAISGEMLDHVITALDLVENDGIPTMQKPFTIAELSEVLKGMSKNQFF
jgi:DNA-binding response OmpR family regulator